MGRGTQRHQLTGKHFPSRTRYGKKYRAGEAIVGTAILFCMLAGGLGIAKAQTKRVDNEAATANAVAAHRATITFAENAVVSTDEVTLADIASIQSDDADLCKQLAAIVIGPGPHIGQVLNFRGDGLRLLMRRDRRELGIDAADIALQGADLTRIVAESQTIEPDALLDAITQWAADQAKNTYGAHQVRIDYRMTPDPIAITKGAWEAKPQMARLPSRVPTTLSVPVAIAVDGRIVTNVTLALNLQMQSMVAVATKPVARHEALSPENVEFVDVDLASLNGSPMAHDAEHLNGLRATRDIMVGDPLTDTNAEQTPLVEKGDQVTVYLQSQLIRLTTVGEAQQDGRAGELIKIRNLRSDKIIRATVVGERVVRVELPGLQVAAAETALAP